jgi:hypothetical protein
MSNFNIALITVNKHLISERGCKDFISLLLQKRILISLNLNIDFCRHRLLYLIILSIVNNLF